MSLKKTALQYYITYERDARGGYVASAPALPGCVVYGKTLPAAHRNITAAIAECLEVIQPDYCTN
ncbi:MAG: type II toxin-antitoxin system HicB family antitoxin [Candidatus Magasanikbacteria bacterium]|nr:type II toxin-antitoxin system HicB family antitoxin [Candidatus Magasanikbacteria bacterium]